MAAETAPPPPPHPRGLASASSSVPAERARPVKRPFGPWASRPRARKSKIGTSPRGAQKGDKVTTCQHKDDANSKKKTIRARASQEMLLPPPLRSLSRNLSLSLSAGSNTGRSCDVTGDEGGCFEYEGHSHSLRSGSDKRCEKSQQQSRAFQTFRLGFFCC